MDILEIDNITLNFDGKDILKSIYFKAEKGKVTGILGSNGSGKTSLLRIIFGELTPTNKLIKIDKIPFRSKLYKKGFIRYLPQFQIFPDAFSLQEAFHSFNVSMNDFLKNFPNFKEKENHYFFQFSGGEKRLIETFIILKSDAKIILLDEPFSHLAPLYISRIKELIKQEKQYKIIIITDHLFKDILDISDTTYLLKEGWSKLLQNPEDLIFHKYTNSI